MSMRKRNYTVVCNCIVCGSRFRASRIDAKYCKSACRTKASRARRGGSNKSTILPTLSQMNMFQLDKLLNVLPYAVVACGCPS